MNIIKDRETVLKVSLVLSILGLIIPNGIFLYYFFTDYIMFQSALSNPISLVFLIEAFVLTFYFAWLIGKMNNQPFSAFVFILLSIVGSLGFSVPFFIYRLLKKEI